MCKQTGNIITIAEAQRRAEDAASKNPAHYFYYWRTNSGRLRKTGYVWICACGKVEAWGMTKDIASRYAENEVTS